MMRIHIWLSIFVGVLSPVSVSAQEIVGSWKHKIFYQKVLSSGEKRFPFGEKIVGRSIYTKEGTFCTMTTGADRKQSANAPTDEERVSLFKTMYAYCGTYRADGPKLILQPDIAWTPNWTQRPGNLSWKLDGKILSIESASFKSQLDGVDVVTVLEFEKE
jgi:Lipocalin-like domain